MLIGASDREWKRNRLTEHLDLIRSVGGKLAFPRSAEVFAKETGRR